MLAALARKAGAVSWAAWAGPLGLGSWAALIRDCFTWSHDPLKWSYPRGKRGPVTERRVMGFGREKYKKEK